MFEVQGRIKLVALVIDDRSIARSLKDRRADGRASPGYTPAPPYFASAVLRRKTLTTLAQIDMPQGAAFDSKPANRTTSRSVAEYRV
jgi:hypothetical protein